MEKWIEIRKGGDFVSIGKKHGIDPVLARLIRNREVVGDEAIEEYLHGKKLHNPHLMKDMDLSVALVKEKIETGKKIRVIGDYDIDGINASYILLTGLLRVGAKADNVIPNRILDGYGVNEHLVSQAKEDGIDTIITCDNGIAAMDAIHAGKELGMTVIVTDHHDIPYEEVDGEKHYLRSEADAIINPKQVDCPYPYKGLCGAVVAWKFVQALYEAFQIPAEEAEVFYENAAFATIGDVMDLTGENRIIVKEGLKRLKHTKNYGLRALIFQNNIDPAELRAYHIGFILGPCMNASGRLDTARRSLELLQAKDALTASQLAGELIQLNASRKDMTAKGVEAAMTQIAEEGLDQEKVLIVYLPDCHESLAGIIAGRIREAYHKPVFVLTKAEEGVKGSGRSIEEYSMFEEMTRCKQYFSKFGGHPMAAGLSMEENQIEPLRKAMNENCHLTEDDLQEKVKIDLVVPLSYLSESLIYSLDQLEPFGKGNSKPVFAVREVEVLSARVLGKNQNVLKLTVLTEDGKRMEAMKFGDPESFFQYAKEKYSKEQLEDLKIGKRTGMKFAFIYYPKINEYQGNRSIQIVISYFR